MTLDVAATRKRVRLMVAINVVAVAAALASIVAYFRFAQEWALFVFAAALIAGFGAQIWLIATLKRASADMNSSVRTRTNRGA